MRSTFTAFVVVFYALGLVMADDKPTVVAIWEHQVVGRDAKPSKMTLYSNSKINDPDGKNTWLRNGNTLTLHWPNPNAPGGEWIDRCTVSPDGTTYSGRNQNGTKISGKLVSEAAAQKPKASPIPTPPPATNKGPKTAAGQTPPVNPNPEGKPQSDIESLKTKASAGNAQSMYELGVHYCSGTGVPKDEKKGIACLERAAKAGHADAMNDLGCCYYYGLCVKKDLKLAKKWLEKAAHAGSPKAQHAFAQASGKSNFKDISDEQKANLAIGLLMMAWATTPGPTDESRAAEQEQSNAMRQYFRDRENQERYQQGLPPK